jgi:predicted ribosome quality control (RQC) complex YloA/Tae2 family protein
VGRDQIDNEVLEKYASTMTNLFCKDHNGPLVLIDGDVSEEELELAAKITAHFGKGRDEESVFLNVRRPGMEVIKKEIARPNQCIIEKRWYIL